MSYLDIMIEVATQHVPVAKTSIVSYIPTETMQVWVQDAVVKTSALVLTGLIKSPGGPAMPAPPAVCPQPVEPPPCEKTVPAWISHLAGMATAVGLNKAKEFCCGHRRRPVRDVGLQSQCTYLENVERFKYLGPSRDLSDEGQVYDNTYQNSRYAACKRHFKKVGAIINS